MLKEDIEKLKKEPQFVAKIKEAKTESELFSIIKETGCEINQKEWKEFVSSTQNTGELSDEELGQVVGGSLFGDLRAYFLCSRNPTYICYECSKYETYRDGEWWYYKCNCGHYFYKKKSEYVWLGD
ncbi:Nif11-like leader peptide family RiPP precursor [Petroclostridium sp. X23]|uniref:Nif11-like leader peptide family RiPP precursor n=1 Tax=Petroclostridium sp. X23 TaxID=3045146 RepID=UPI0024AD7FC1|nr:Nif11-like leader peptide family RiPP precursor [Petroclostridium sp. X23]WHH59690.1 Nif11-like leader peptide family RiPP precursor [Petroclostridium sp. X23]